MGSSASSTVLRQAFHFAKLHTDTNRSWRETDRAVRPWVEDLASISVTGVSAAPIVSQQIEQEVVPEHHTKLKGKGWTCCVILQQLDAGQIWRKGFLLSC